ncbi:DUF6232 family protein [Micromonospora sp. LOL_023]|uniref:DUF6232 family protein n=1 Tax=Micromonospora sp. LOL_023 TaxID=3345418 RepID=UPI003A841D2D
MRATRQTPPLRGSPTTRPDQHRGARSADQPLIPRARNSRFLRQSPPTDGVEVDPRGRGGRYPGPAFYRQPGICVTPEWFIVAGRRFAIRSLTELRTARGPRDRLTGRAVAVTAVVLAGIAMTIGFTKSLHEVSAGGYLALLVAAFIPVCCAWIGDRLRPRPFELWGRHEGLMVILFSTDEERQYGQVSRAVMRAREMCRLAGLSDPVTIEPWVPDQRGAVGGP